MKKLVLVAGLLACSLASAQQPQLGGVNYNYLELRYLDVDANGGQGWLLGGSIDVGDNFILLGSITGLSFDFNIDANLYRLGGGYVWHYNPDWDFLATAQYVNVDIDGSDDDNGVQFTGGTRGLITPQFEVRGFVHYTTAVDSDTWLEIAGDYRFNNQFAAGVSIEFGGDTDVFTIGGRFYFR